MRDIYKINSLEQVRLLADPLKLRIVQAFAEQPRTTRDVAERLGENLTRLYRHVDALHDAGLLEVTEEQRKRGTVERTFSAVGRRFEADQSLFTGDTEDDKRAAVLDLLRTSQQEILDAVAGSTGSNEVLLARLRCRASPERVADLHRMLGDWLEAAEQDDDCADGQEIGALVALYPVAGPETG